VRILFLSRSCTGGAYIYTRCGRRILIAPKQKKNPRKLQRVYTNHPLATSDATGVLTTATRELAAQSKPVELQVKKGKIVPLSSCWQLSQARARPSLCRSCVFGRLRPCRDGKARATVRSQLTGQALHARRELAARFTSESCVWPGCTPPLAARFFAAVS
jgi:hypothetical protein